MRNTLSINFETPFEKVEAATFILELVKTGLTWDAVEKSGRLVITFTGGF